VRVFVAGASGAIGTRLVPQLIDRGHEVIGTFKSPQKEGRLRATGVEAVHRRRYGRSTELTPGTASGPGGNWFPWAAGSHE
jgi:nucleoside-diphosphate-sugar epimerase